MDLFGLIGGFSLTDNLSGPTMGLAVEYQVLDYVSLEAKYQVSQLDPAVGTGFNVNSLMLGVGLNFRSSK